MRRSKREDTGASESETGAQRKGGAERVQVESHCHASVTCSKIYSMSFRFDFGAEELDGDDQRLHESGAVETSAAKAPAVGTRKTDPSMEQSDDCVEISLDELVSSAMYTAAAAE